MSPPLEVEVKLMLFIDDLNWVGMNSIIAQYSVEKSFKKVIIKSALFAKGMKSVCYKNGIKI